MTPNDITVGLSGPFYEILDNQKILDNSNIVDMLEENLCVSETEGGYYAFYEDHSFTNSRTLIPPFDIKMSLGEESSRESLGDINQAMSEVKKPFEWEFDYMGFFFFYIACQVQAWATIITKSSSNGSSGFYANEEYPDKRFFHIY